MNRPIFRFTRFDLTVLSVAMVLTAAIILTAVFGITEQPVRIAYLKIGADTQFYDVWIADPENPDDAEQITETQYGVFDYDVSADGHYIAYSERDFNTGIMDLYLLDLRTKNIRRLTNCVMEDSDCSSPAFRPDGDVIAYERRQLNTGTGLPVGTNRIWLLDITTEPANTYPLFDDSQIVGYDARWSADGTKITFYDSANSGILIYDFNAAQDGDSLKFIPTNLGENGALAPDGTQMVFLEMLLDNSQSRGYLQLADLETGVFQVLVDPNDNADDRFLAWNPDGQRVAVARRYWDDRYTRGEQIYLMDMTDNSVTPLIYDEKYSSGFIVWDAEGKRIASQRFQMLDDAGNIYGGGTTEVWTYNMETGQLVKIAENARLPLWVAGQE